MADLLQIGTSGLLTYQAGIQTTGHNIANASVEGYSRQEVNYKTRIPQRGAGGYIGSGVQTENIRRISNQFLTNQLRSATEEFARQSTFVDFVTQLESLVASESSGLSGALQSFFSSLQVAGEDPASLTGRQQILSEAENLATRFNTIYNRITGQATSVNQQIELAVSEINDLAGGIAELNNKIALAQGQAGGASPNDLLDQREILLQRLSELVSVNTSFQDGNQINVFIGKGQSLVLGPNTSPLRAEDSRSRPGEVDILIGSSDVSNGIDLGELGALLKIREEILDPALNTIGQIAIGFSIEMNRQQEKGIDLFGQLGDPLFADVNRQAARLDRVVPNLNNDKDGDGVVGVRIEDIAKLTTEDYRLEFTGPTASDFVLTRASNGEIVKTGAFGSSLPASVLTSEGFSIELESGSFTVGDSLLIQPTRKAALEFDVKLDRVENLALGQAVRGRAAVHNTGAGSISNGEVLDVRTTNGTGLLADFATAQSLSPPLLVRFTSPTSYDILDNSDPNNPVDLMPPQNGLNFVPGSDNSLFPTDPINPAYRGYIFSIGGEPATGDEFFIEFNTDGVGDNRNAVAMVALQNRTIFNNGVHSVNSAYAGFVQGIAAEVGQAKIDRDASEALLNQTQSARDSLSGVNLDEEAARLIQLEQAYNASAQVIQVGRELFDILLNAVS